MLYRKLPNSDMKVSVLSLGTMTFGEQTGKNDAFAQMDMAIENGINLFDTAELYPPPARKETIGLTESIVGEYIKDRGIRNEVLIASKVAGGGYDWLRDGEGVTAKNILAAIDGSLQRLNRDCIDIYQLHWPYRYVNKFGKLDFDIEKPLPDSESDKIEESLYAMTELKKAGKIRHVGLSNETPYGVMRYMELHRNKGLEKVSTIQNVYSLVSRSLDINLSEVLLRENVGLLAYSSLAGGVLTGKYIENIPKDSRFGSEYGHQVRQDRYIKNSSNEAVISYNEIAKRYGISLTHLALAFVNSRKYITSNIIGSRKLYQLEDAIKCADIKLSDEIIDEINSIHAMNPSPSNT